jgi:hypothetical protein
MNRASFTQYALRNTRYAAIRHTPVRTQQNHLRTGSPNTCRLIASGLLLALASLVGGANATHAQPHQAAGAYLNYDFDYGAPLIGITFRLRPEASFAYSAHLEYLHQASADAEDPKARITQLDLGGLVSIVQSGPLSVWAGGGPALQYVHVNTRRDSTGVTVEGQNDLRFGFNGSGEARLRLIDSVHLFAHATLTLGTPVRTRSGGGLLVRF